MKKQGNRLTTNQIVDIYFLKKEGLALAEIDQKLGLYDGCANSTLGSLKKYFNNFYTGRKIKAYTKAVAKIRSRNMLEAKNQKASQPVANGHTSNGIAKVPQVENPIPKADHYNNLKSAYANFETALQNFIEVEFASRNKQLLTEIKELKEENELMEEAFQKAKNSNWIDNLFKKEAKVNHG